MATIKANELRIGNLVYTTPLGVNKLYEIGTLDFAQKVVDDYSPIPLTPEILIVCGFELHDGGQLPEYIQRNGFMMFWCDETLSANFGHVADLSVEIRYLHQLQNLYFALTQSELTINPQT